MLAQPDEPGFETEASEDHQHRNDRAPDVRGFGGRDSCHGPLPRPVRDTGQEQDRGDVMAQDRRSNRDDRLP